MSQLMNVEKFLDNLQLAAKNQSSLDIAGFLRKLYK